MSVARRRETRLDLLRWFPLNAKRVLEVASTNSLNSAAMQLNADVKFSTLEHFADSQNLLPPSRTDRLYQEENETLLGVKGLERGFDLALAHELPGDPSELEELLQRLNVRLANGGHLIGCLNHTQEFIDNSILDSRASKSNEAYDYYYKLANFFSRRGFVLLKIFPHTAQSHLNIIDPLQYVIVARKMIHVQTVDMMRLHVCAMAPRFLDVRTRLPAEALDSLPDLVVTRTEKSLQLPPYPLAAPKICVLQRLAIANEPAYWNWVRDRIREGWLLVGESDDHPALMAAVHGRDPQQESWLSITGVHAVQTSTPALGEAYRQQNAEVAVFPNAVFSLPPFIERPGPLRIFLGALNRERVTAQVGRALASFCKAHPEAEFVVVHDRAFFSALPTTRKTLHPASDYDTYLSLMGGCHVALMPLEGSFGETFKSDVKFLEAASRGVVAIASPTVYAGTIVDGETGLIAKSIQDWARLLHQLAEDGPLRKRLARVSWNYVRRERMFAGQIQARRDWYNSLWDRRDALTKALVARHPELRLA